MQGFAQVIHDFSHGNLRGFGIRTALVLGHTVLQALVAQHHAVRHANQLLVGKHGTRAFAAIVQDHVHALGLQVSVQLVSRSLDSFRAVVAHRDRSY